MKKLLLIGFIFILMSSFAQAQVHHPVHHRHRPVHHRHHRPVHHHQPVHHR